MAALLREAGSSMTQAVGVNDRLSLSASLRQSGSHSQGLWLTNC